MARSATTAAGLLLLLFAATALADGASRTLSAAGIATAGSIAIGGVNPTTTTNVATVATPNFAAALSASGARNGIARADATAASAAFGTGGLAVTNTETAVVPRGAASRSASSALSGRRLMAGYAAATFSGTGVATPNFVATNANTAALTTGTNTRAGAAVQATATSGGPLDFAGAVRGGVAAQVTGGPAINIQAGNQVQLGTARANVVGTVDAAAGP